MMKTWWVRPYTVLERTGQSSFKIQIKPRVTKEVHLDQIKPYKADRVLGLGRPLFFAKGTPPRRLGCGCLKKFWTIGLTPKGNMSF